DNYQAAAKIAPADPQYVFAQGFLEASRGRYPQATTLYLESLKIDSTFDKSLAQLHDLYLTHYENEEEAMQFNARLLRNHPGHALGRFQEGNYYLREALNIMGMNQLKAFENYVNEAVSAYSIAVNRDPNLTQAWYNRGYCYFLGNGREGAAVEDFEKCLELDPDYAPAHFMIGSIFEKNGDLQTALKRYENAAQLDPGSKDYRKAVKEVRAQLNG
ncbi:MAG: tetratricopeptide repeat protein, partial [Bacteroidota bacterium]